MQALERAGRENGGEAGHGSTAGGTGGSREAGGSWGSPGLVMGDGRKRVKTLAPGLTDCSGR